MFAYAIELEEREGRRRWVTVTEHLGHFLNKASAVPVEFTTRSKKDQVKRVYQAVIVRGHLDHDGLHVENTRLVFTWAELRDFAIIREATEERLRAVKRRGQAGYLPGLDWDKVRAEVARSKPRRRETSTAEAITQPMRHVEPGDREER